jgi:hypothetical protein
MVATKEVMAETGRDRNEEKEQMRSHMLRIIHFATDEVGPIFLLLALAIGVTSIPAYAQEGIWQVDAEHSIARLSLGSGSQSAEVGVARVSGNVAFDPSDSADPVVNLNIKPGKSQGTDYSEISFKSKRSAVTGDGKLAVIGDLSLTRVERSVAPAYVGGGEGYYGAEYGEPVVHTDTREVTFVFPSAAQPAAQNGTMQLSAVTNISRERFPQLMAALAPGNWPTVVVEDEKCTATYTGGGEGYYGATCTGTPVATATNAVNPYVGGGEGYYGFEPAVVPDGSQATIALNLKLTQLAPAPSAASGAAKAAGN